MALVNYTDSESESDSSSSESVDHNRQTMPQGHHQSRHDRALSNSQKIVYHSSTAESESKSTATASSGSTGPALSLPALPPIFHSLYASTVRTSIEDDPTLHSGRTRQTPHVQGSWPTHIYLECFPTKTERSILNPLTTSYRSTLSSQVGRNGWPPNEAPTIHTLLYSPLGVPLPLHISLSRPLTLQTDQKTPFLDALATQVIDSNIPSFSVQVGRRLDWVPNFDRSRWFLVLQVERPKTDALNRLLDICNSVVAKFGLGKLYEQPGNDTGVGSLTKQWRRRQQQQQQPQQKGSRPKDRAKQDFRPAKRQKRGNTTAFLREELDDEDDDDPKADRSNCFHISIAWTLTDPSTRREADPSSSLLDRSIQPEMTSEEATMPATTSTTTTSGTMIMEPTFSRVKLKMGNIVHDIPLGCSRA